MKHKEEYLPEHNPEHNPSCPYSEKIVANAKSPSYGLDDLFVVHVRSPSSKVVTPYASASSA
jgi:hypothetical protein